MVITADEGVRAGKTIGLKATVDKAIDGLPSVSTVLVMQRTKANVPMKHGRDVYLDEVRVADVHAVISYCLQWFCFRRL